MPKVEDLCSTSAEKRYMAAIALLAANELCITQKRIALLSRSNTQAVKTWVHRNRHRLRELPIQDGKRFKRNRTIWRLRWCLHLAPKDSLSVSEIAGALRFERTAFFRLMRKDELVRALVTEALR